MLLLVLLLELELEVPVLQATAMRTSHCDSAGSECRPGGAKLGLVTGPTAATASSRPKSTSKPGALAAAATAAREAGASEPDQGPG